MMLVTDKNNNFIFTGTVHQWRVVESCSVSKLHWRNNDVVWSLSDLYLSLERMGTHCCHISYFRNIPSNKPQWNTPTGEVSYEEIWIKSGLPTTY